MQLCYLDGDGMDRSSDLKAALLKHHDRRVVDTSSCYRDTDRHYPAIKSRLSLPPPPPSCDADLQEI